MNYSKQYIRKQNKRSDQNTIVKNNLYNNSTIQDNLFNDPAFNEPGFDDNAFNNINNNKKKNYKTQSNTNFSNKINIDSTVIELNDKLRPAIVSIVTKYSKRQLNTDQTLSGSGFFIKYNNKLYIVSSAHIVLHTTVIDPMTTIFCSVMNVNLTKLNLIFKARIIGVDATADVAILELIRENQIDFPQVSQHPFINLGDEKKTLPGTDIFNISNPLTKDRDSFVRGSIRDNKWFDNTGSIIVSCITTDLLVYPGCSGSPILDSKTGLCLGIIDFGFTDSMDINNIGFVGGCGVSTLKIILNHILNFKSVQTVKANDGTIYLTNLKGFLGYINFIGANANSITNLFPSNYQKLQVRGIILTKIDPMGPLATPLNNAQPLKLGDIIVSLTRSNGVRTIFGPGQDQFPVGEPLWKINPLDNCKNIVDLGIIRNPSVNSKIELIKVRLNQTYDPVYERPNTDNRTLGTVGDALQPITDAFNSTISDAYAVNPFLGAVVQNSPLGGLNDIVNVVQDTANFFENLF